MITKQQGRPVWLTILFGVVLGIVLSTAACGTWWFFSEVRPDSHTYQAVFLSNGQVYFGRLHCASSKSPVLDDVFYLQSNGANQQVLQANASGTPSDVLKQPQFSLTKLGTGEVHAPTDAMYLNRSQILFWENLRADSPVIQSIVNFKKQK